MPMPAMLDMMHVLRPMFSGRGAQRAVKTRFRTQTATARRADRRLTEYITMLLMPVSC